MAWQDTLIQLYLYICQHYQSHLGLLTQRLSNNNQLEFTDEEVLTIYLFGIIKRHRTIQAIYTYTTDHLLAWFPALPSYGGYVQRLNRLHEVFARLVEDVLAYSDRSRPPIPREAVHHSEGSRPPFRRIPSTLCTGESFVA